MAPIIGITTYGRDEKTVISEGVEAFVAVPVAYVDAVRRAGGVPVLLPPGEADLEAWCELCDGFVFSGGADISPDRYGGDASHLKLGAVSAERDQTEFALLERLLAGAKPMLMICRGFQVLNVALGGDLHEHIADVHPENIHQGRDTIWTMQPVQAIGRLGVRELVGMSGHHQGIKSLGRGLEVIAEASDGIVEAVELADHAYCVAVQWHPEMTAADDPAQQAIFDDFLRACGVTD